MRWPSLIVQSYFEIQVWGGGEQVKVDVQERGRYHASRLLVLVRCERQANLRASFPLASTIFAQIAAKLKRDGDGV